MSAGVVVTVLVAGVLVVATVLGWSLPRRSGAGLATGAALAGGLSALGLVAVVAGPVASAPGLVGSALLVDLFVVAAAGGGPLTDALLALVDRGAPAGRQRSRHAEEVLRGGAWIGVFERTAVFASLVAGWPEGLAVVLALKGLGRYHELRADAGDQTSATDRPGTTAGATAGATQAVHGGVAERFIIGTFASVLWAAGCAGAYLGLTW